MYYCTIGKEDIHGELTADLPNVVAIVPCVVVKPPELVVPAEPAGVVVKPPELVVPAEPACVVVKPAADVVPAEPRGVVVACPLLVVAGAAAVVPGTFPGVVVPGKAVVGAPGVVVAAEKQLQVSVRNTSALLQ